jgi:single-strand DNA-binding protein
MNVVVVRGRLSSPPVIRELASGSKVLSLELTTATPQGASSVPAAWLDPPADADFADGDELLVLGSVRRRFFRVAGATQSRTEVVVSEACPAKNRRRCAKLLSAAAEALDG